VNQSNVRFATQELNLHKQSTETKSALETNNPDTILNLRIYRGESLLNGKGIHMSHSTTDWHAVA
jgi:hypothetical protein